MTDPMDTIKQALESALRADRFDGWIAECKAALAALEEVGRGAEDSERLLLNAARSLLSYDASYGGGGGQEEAFEIVRKLGYEDGLAVDDVIAWITAREKGAPNA